nr:putative ribonuclease h protein [Quercus suber]
MLSRCNDGTRWINWEKPDLNWFKLNIDGSSIGNPGKAGGGIIRNQHGNWVRGFARSIGIASSVVAEL